MGNHIINKCGFEFIDKIFHMNVDIRKDIVMKIRNIKKEWLSVFGKDVDQKLIREHVTSYGNYLWHLFTWGNVICLEKDEARKVFDELNYKEAIKFTDGYSNRITGISVIEKVSAKDIDEDPESDVYIVASDFSWTYVRTHERDLCGPFLCIKK